jgi:hypothetical protein
MAAVVATSLVLSCDRSPAQQESRKTEATGNQTAGQPSGAEPKASSPASPASAPTSPPTAPGAAARLMPADLVYQGAFRLPDGPEEFAWLYSGQGLTYYPDGDPKGPDDGTPGSLFGIGHDWNQHVSEISIPKPVVSKAKNLAELPTATTLQPFANVRGSLFPGDLEQARGDIEYLPPQGKQKTGKLYFCWGPHMHDAQAVPSHGMCELTLKDPKPAGPWKFGDLWTYLTCDYIFAIDPAWAARNTPGMLLATGRFRDGGQGSMGPALFAYGPWNEGDPPAAGASLKAVPLLRYGSVYDGPEAASRTMKDYHHSDDWAGGAWLTAGDKAAVIFVGTKGRGKCWYGFANGVVWPEEGPWPEVPPAPNDQRGWWSTEFLGRMLFYDPADLAAVVAGKMKPWQPQPYATMDLDPVLFGVTSKQKTRHVGDVTFDRQRGLVYMIEFRGDEDKSLVHVWKIAAKK